MLLMLLPFTFSLLYALLRCCIIALSNYSTLAFDSRRFFLLHSLPFHSHPSNTHKCVCAHDVLMTKENELTNLTNLQCMHTKASVCCCCYSFFLRCCCCCCYYSFTLNTFRFFFSFYFCVIFRFVVLCAVPFFFLFSSVCELFFFVRLSVFVRAFVFLKYIFVVNFIHMSKKHYLLVVFLFLPRWFLIKNEGKKTTNNAHTPKTEKKKS